MKPPPVDAVALYSQPGPSAAELAANGFERWDLLPSLAWLKETALPPGSPAPAARLLDAAGDLFGDGRNWTIATLQPMFFYWTEED